jgi:hypothetical protein
MQWISTFLDRILSPDGNVTEAAEFCIRIISCCSNPHPSPDMYVRCRCFDHELYHIWLLLQSPSVSSIRAYFNLQSLHQANKVGTFRIMIAMIMILDFWMTSLIFLCWFWVLMATGNSGPFERGNCRNHIIMFVHVFPDHFRTLSLALAIFWVYYITPYFLDLMLRYLVTPFSKAKRWFDKHSYSLLLLRIPLRFILALPHALFLFIAQDFIYIFGQTDKV